MVNQERQYLERDARGPAWPHATSWLQVDRSLVDDLARGVEELEPTARGRVVDLLMTYALCSAVPPGAEAHAWPPASVPIDAHVGGRVAVAFCSRRSHTWYVEGGVIERHRDFEQRLFLVADTRLDPDGRVALLDYKQQRTLADRGNSYDVDIEAWPMLLLPVCPPKPQPCLRPTLNLIRIRTRTRTRTLSLTLSLPLPCEPKCSH